VSVEREKRLRVEGSDQFCDLASEGTHSATDPNVEPDRGLARRLRRPDPDLQPPEISLKKTSLETFLGK